MHFLNCLTYNSFLPHSLRILCSMDQYLTVFLYLTITTCKCEVNRRNSSLPKQILSNSQKHHSFTLLSSKSCALCTKFDVRLRNAVPSPSRAKNLLKILDSGLMVINPLFRCQILKLKIFLYITFRQSHSSVVWVIAFLSLSTNPCQSCQ